MEKILLFLLFLSIASAQFDLFKWFDYNTLPEVCYYPLRRGYSASMFRNREGVTNWWFNATSGECEYFEYLGRGGNRNRFSNPIQCMRTCGCRQEKDPGRCYDPNEPTVKRYHYNPMLGMCVDFEHSGCGGNANHFYTFFECMLTCRRSGNPID